MPAEIFDAKEAELVGRVLAACDGPDGKGAELLRKRLAELAQIGDLLEGLPSLLGPGAQAAWGRDEDKLLEQLCAADRYAGALALPSKAGLARAFLVGKVQFFKAMRLTLPPKERELGRGLRGKLALTVFTLLAEELLQSLVNDRELPLAMRRRSARILVWLWDSAVLVEIADFLPVLQHAWDARTLAGSVLGTLMGTAEYFRLVQQKCPETVLAFFSRNEIPEHESQAFQEFLLGLPWDDVERLREQMKRDRRPVIDGDYALSHLTLPPTQLQTTGDPEALYASFHRREFHAALRRKMKQPGPTRTAEAYLLVHLLSS